MESTGKTYVGSDELYEEVQRTMRLCAEMNCGWHTEAGVDFSKQKASGKYVCSICGYVYDPAEHNGVPFEELPADWKCPRCKQGKEKFNKA